MTKFKDERVKQVIVGASILSVLTIIIPSALLGWRLLPGLLGEWTGSLLGIMTTPFFMEASFSVIGLFIVIFLNLWRRRQDGDEFVYLEQVNGPDIPKNLPEQAKWAIYPKKPLDFQELSLLEQAEGAFAIGDYANASEWIGTMLQEELMFPETLHLRIELAKATGRHELAAILAAELKIVESKSV